MRALGGPVMCFVIENVLSEAEELVGIFKLERTVQCCLTNRLFTNVHEHNEQTEHKRTPKPRSLFVFVRNVHEQLTNSTNKFYCIKFDRNWTPPFVSNKPQCLNGCLINVEPDFTEILIKKREIHSNGHIKSLQMLGKTFTRKIQRLFGQRFERIERVGTSLRRKGIYSESSDIGKYSFFCDSAVMKFLIK